MRDAVFFWRELNRRVKNNWSLIFLYSILLIIFVTIHFRRTSWVAHERGVLILKIRFGAPFEESSPLWPQNDFWQVQILEADRSRPSQTKIEINS